MESPVVVDKPPEYHGKAANSNERGFPFDEEEGSGAWSELAARHPDIAARLRQRPATWARKRRPSSQDATDDFGDSFGGFDRFPFDDIPPEFRDHFPSHWNRRFASRDEPQPQSQGPPPPQSPQQQTTATQTEQNQRHSTQEQQTHLPQYGLRNTVDLGQKSPADPSLVDADDRNQRSMSAPPDNRTANQNCTSKMNSQNHHEQPQQQQPPQAEQQSSNVRHIPIFVEGRDEPVINKSVDHGAHFGETKPTYAHSPPQQPHIEREQYFSDDVPVNFHHPPNFSRAFGTPFNKGFRQGPQPFVQQKVYPQTAFARGASPQRSQSPKPQMHPEEHYVKVPVHHDHAAPKTEPSRAQQRQPPQQHAQQQQHPPQQQQPQHQQQQQQQSPQQQQDPPQPKPQQPPTNDPITQILSIQTDVLNLMTEVENFTGTKKDKRYLFLDEMLTRNLIKLDNIETDGKENIRLARKEAIRCIQKCIAVLEAKAEKGTAASQPQDIEMKENSQNEQSVEEKPAVENGEVEMNEAAKEEKVEPQTEQQPAQPQPQEEKKEEQKPQEEKKNEAQSQEINKEAVQLQAADTRPEEKTAEQKSDVKQEEQKNQENVEKKKDGPKKGAKNVKKRDKSKENNKEATNKDEKIEDKKSEGKKEQKKVEDKKEKVEEKKEKVEDKKEKVEDKKEKVENKKEKAEDKKIEDMQVDEKGDKTDSQTMDVDGASASQ